MNSKRTLCSALVLMSLLPACGAAGRQLSTARPLSDAQRRLRNMGLVLVTDAVAGSEMLGVEFYADGVDRPFFASSTLRKGNRAIMAFPISVVPEQVRVVWRDSSRLVRRVDDPAVTTYAGNVLGDYSTTVAGRIPDDVVIEVRRHGGSLRLKFRLKPDGVLFGWDVERFSGGLPRHSMAGGDFLETEY